MNNIVARVARHYGIYVPMATQLRKKTATACALRGTDKERTLLSKVMSHTVETHKHFYEQIGTSSHAAEAHKAAKRMRDDTAKGPPKRKQSRQKYTASEEKVITSYFRKEIENQICANLAETS